MSIFALIAFAFVSLALFGYWAIRQMASTGKEAENLANEGREKLKLAQENSLSSQAEIRRLNETISNLRRRGGQHTGNVGNKGLEIISRKEAQQVLGLEDNFTQEDLKKMHRHLSKKIHPDMQGSTGLFILLNSAYELLKKQP